jgi:hypothetical protein
VEIVGMFGDKLAMEIDGDIGWRAAIVGLGYIWASFLEAKPLQTKRHGEVESGKQADSEI